MDDHSGQPERLIEFTRAAALDFASIDNATAAIWGAEQAGRYVTSLEATFDLITTYPGLGVTIDPVRGYQSYVTRFRMRRGAHGHRIVYREIEGGIRIIRILHTAMNWQDHI